MLPGDRHSFTVSDLDPDSTYNFQVSYVDDGDDDDDDDDDYMACERNI